MRLKIDTKLAYEFKTPTAFLLQIEAADIPEQQVTGETLDCTPTEHFARVPAQDDIGHRIWMRHQGMFEARYTAEVSVNRRIGDIAKMAQVEPHLLPAETVQYLMESRYCPADKLRNFVDDEFGHLAGGARIAAMRDWIHDNFDYTPGASDASTTGLDSFVMRRGVCRDYAHVMITLARASAVPARIVSAYAPDVEPPDFHAVAEVFLLGDGGGEWQLVDPTGMAQAGEIAKIGTGRDAADVSFLTCYGNTEMKAKTVSVSRA